MSKVNDPSYYIYRTKRMMLFVFETREVFHEYSGH